MNDLTTIELEGMRTTAEAALPDACRYRSVTVTSDGRGGQTITLGSPVTFDCRVGAAKRQQVIEGGSLQTVDEYPIAAPWDVVIDLTAVVEHYAPKTIATRANNAAVVLGQLVQPTPANEHYYINVKAGTTAGSQPVFGTGAGSLTTDGTARWQEAGDPTWNRYEVVSVSDRSWEITQKIIARRAE
jgi:hypothetical protein